MEIFFYTYLSIIAVPALLFSILNWRLKKPVLFWLAVFFTALIIAYYLFNLSFVMFVFLDIDNLIAALVLLLILGIPLYFIISSRLSTGSAQKETDITDDYLNKIIEEEDYDGDFEN